MVILTVAVRTVYRNARGQSIRATRARSASVEPAGPHDARRGLYQKYTQDKRHGALPSASRKPIANAGAPAIEVSPPSGLEPPVDLVHPVVAPERLAVDDEEG